MRNPDASLPSLAAVIAQANVNLNVEVDAADLPKGRFVLIDRMVIASFYGLVAVAAASFVATWWLPRLDVEDYMALSWGCIFGASLCLLTRLGVLVLEDVGDTPEGRPAVADRSRPGCRANPGLAQPHGYRVPCAASAERPGPIRVFSYSRMMLHARRWGQEETT
jgi:hypothetical protein